MIVRPSDHSRAATRNRAWPARVAASVVVLALLALGGCTSVSGSAADAIRLMARHDPGVDAARVARSPYYQLRVTTGKRSALLILGNLDGSREAWYGEQGVVIFLRHGQVVKTAGLAQNLAGMHQPTDNPFARGLQHLTAPVAYTRSEDWSPSYRYGVPAHVRLAPMGTTQITILGQPRTVLRVVETLDAPAAHFHASNQYWVDPDNGLVWRSEQQIAPGLTLTLTQLKPFRGALP